MFTIPREKLSDNPLYAYVLRARPSVHKPVSTFIHGQYEQGGFFLTSLSIVMLRRKNKKTRRIQKNLNSTLVRRFLVRCAEFSCFYERVLIKISRPKRCDVLKSELYRYSGSYYSRERVRENATERVIP